MKLDLGIARIEVPDDDLVLPSLVIGVGREDKQAALSAGPTMAKTKTHAYQRTLAVQFSPVEKGEDQKAAVDRGLNELVNKTGGGKIRKSQDLELMGSPAKTIEIAYKAPDEAPVVTRALVVCARDFLQSIMLTCLDDPKASAAVDKQFTSIVSTIQPGAYFD